MEKETAQDPASSYTLRDVITLVAIPALSADHDPERLARSVAAAVVDAVRLEFAFVSLRGWEGEPAAVGARVPDRPEWDTRPGQLESALAPWPEWLAFGVPQSIRDPLAEAGAIRVVRIAIGGSGADGHLIAGARRAGFPSDDDRQLLGLAADQTTVLLRRRRVDAVLHRTEERFRRYFELGLVGMAITSPGKGCLEVNDTICEILGYSREELLGTTWAALTHPDDLAGDVAQFGRMTAGEIDGYTMDKRWVRKDGRVIDTTISVKCVRRAGGAVDHCVALLQDVTERKRIEQELRRAKEAAEHANAIKDEFLATVSHELRTPLSAILLWAKILAEDIVGSHDHGRAVRAIVESGEAQGRLIEDLLDVSRLASGTLRVDRWELDLVASAAAVTDAARPMADARGVALVTALLGGEAGLTILGDATRMRQVVWNLVTNAVKFTPAGGRVELSLARHGPVARLVVRDTGKGIATDFLPHVFERFRQEDGGTSRRHGGLGLGLWIVRELVEMHGGHVFAHSDGVGSGATFTVELPLAVGAGRSGDASGAPGPTPGGADEGGPPAARRLAGVRVLLVEDDAAMREVLTLILERAGADLTAADCADDAVRELADQGVTVLVSDIGLPGEDGYSLIARARSAESEGGWPPVPSLALTAHGREADRGRALASGFDAHVAKPVDPKGLIDVVARLAGRA